MEPDTKESPFPAGWETLPREEIRRRQWERLKARLEWIVSHSSFYGRKFEQHVLNPSDLRGWKEFRERVPLTCKDEIRQERERLRDPYGGLLCVDPEEIACLSRTGGTTGVPSVYGLTARDLRVLGGLVARIWHQIGGRRGDSVACATMGTWNAFARGLLEGLRQASMSVYHFAMPLPGEEVFPIEVLPRWLPIQGFYLSGRPLLQITERYGAALRELLPELRYLLTAGQRLSPALREALQELWGARLYEAYPFTDAALPTATCPAQADGFHVPEDAFLVEVIDPEGGEEITESGQVGEFVVTSLMMEGTPLIRFRTGDLGYAKTEPCPCGRTSMRMVLLERSDHSVLVGQRRVFASEVEDVIYRIPELLFAPYYLIKSAQQPQHELILRIGCPEEKRKRPERLLESVVSRLREKLGVEARVQLVGKEDERVLVGYKRTKVIPESDLGQKGRKR